MGFEEAQARKVRAREEGIQRLQSEAMARGQALDRAFWAMVYDFEVAPVTTNRKQLAEMGIEVPAADSLADDEIAVKLKEIVAALASLHVYLLHTDHLSDRDLYRRLAEEVLDEEVRDIPPVHGVREYVDLVGTGSEADAELFDKYYAGSDAEAAPYDRDRHLPRPTDGVPF